MSGSLFRSLRLFGFGALGALVLGLLRSARRQPPPPPSGTASWDPLIDDVPTPSRSGPVQFTDTPEPTAWVEPDAEGGCPDSHPIKGNDQSKIFHVPGGLSYERTQAERCYCDEASAEADGYRRAKR